MDVLHTTGLKVLSKCTDFNVNFQKNSGDYYPDPYFEELRIALPTQPTGGLRSDGGHSRSLALVSNDLPSDVTSAPSLAVFGRRLKTELFRRCYNAA